MKNYFLMVVKIWLFFSYSLNSQNLGSLKSKIDWLTPILISDTAFAQYAIPAMSVKNTDNIIIPFIQSPFRSPDYRNKNVYISYLKDGLQSEPINLTNNFYNSNWPIIKTDRDGITHLIWGYALVDPNSIRHIISTDVYYSYYNDKIWSDPISIFHKETINGTNSYAGPGKLRLDSKNRVHILWQAIDSTGLHIYHLIEENCLWGEIEELPFISADYDYVFDKNDRLHMVYLRPVIGQGSDVNSVFYRYSDDYGRKWSDSVLVHRSFLFRALNVQILLDKKNSIHILWSKHLSGSEFASETVYHSHSSDGKTWVSPTSILHAVEDGILYFNAAIDRNDKIHLFYDQWASLFTPPVKICYTYWDGINWSIPSDEFNNSQMPRIEIDSLNFLHLIFASQVGGYKYYTRTTNPLITSVGEKKNNLPDKYELFQNFPNPFNPSTVINYRIKAGSHVTLKVYDLLGKEVATLVDGYQDAGEYKTQFSILNSQLSSGIYFYKIKAGDFIETKKMVFLK